MGERDRQKAQVSRPIIAWSRPTQALRACRRSATAAFTLLEILLVLALLGLLAGVLVVNTSTLLQDKPATPDEIFFKAVAEARKYAVESNREVRLGFDSKKKAFLASTDEGEKSYPLDFPGELVIEFLAARKGNLITIGGQAVETETVPFVTFYPDGTCSPFRVQLRSGINARVITIDPWTCAPVLEAEKT